MAAGHRVATRSVLEGHEHAGTVTQIEMSGTGMDANTVLALGLGVTSPWRLVDQRLKTGKQPHELHLEVAADRGSLFPCPVCGKPCKAHDFAEFTWRRHRKHGAMAAAPSHERSTADAVGAAWSALIAQGSIRSGERDLRTRPRCRR